MNRSTTHSIRSKNGKWEWVITNLLNESYFDQALDMMKGCGIVFNEHPQCDPLEEIVVGGEPIGDVYAETNKNVKADRNGDGLRIFVTSDKNNWQNKSSLDLIKQSLHSLKLMTASDKLGNANAKVPDVVKDIDKTEGHVKNEYGMLMLSKPINDAYTTGMFFKNQNIRWWWPFYNENWHLTSCLYTGDMCMNRNADMGTILALINYNNNPLQFFQIPHLGSAHNSSLERLQYIETYHYFCYDNNSRRLVNNLGNILTPLNPFIDPLQILLIDRDSEMDEAVCVYH